MKNRRKFLKKAVAGTALATAAPYLALSRSYRQKLVLQEKDPFKNRKFNALDNIRLGAIGMGIIGFYNINTAIKVPGVELVAACDLYDGRLQHVKTTYGNHVATTRDYREILDRDDIDAVLIATPDHWHNKITIEALEKGKAVYCEKPMMHHIDQGYKIMEVARKTGQALQIGSQGVSSIVQDKARQLYEAGEIGELVMVDAAYDRHSSLGAWQYSIPPDASPENVDFDRFLGDAPRVPFDPVRFFRWRNYQEYGTGMAGDLFVHLLSWLHFITGSQGPERVYSSGGLRHWKDGRNVPDIILSLMDYPAAATHPAFNLQIRVNFVAGGGGSGELRLVGTEGAITLQGNRLLLSKTPFASKPGYGGYDSLFTFPEATRKAFEEEYRARYYLVEEQVREPREVEFNAPDGYSDRYSHWVNFAAAMRGEKTIVEDAVFGMRASAPSLAANNSYFEQKPVYWDAKGMKLRKKA